MPTLAPPELSAPFAPGGEAAIDAVLAQRLLAAALESGGDAADLYFEYRVTADYALQEEKVKSVGRGVTLGLGVRVTKGDATGYAFTEDLAWERMLHAARIAGQIATGGGRAQPVAAHAVTLPDYYPVQRLSLIEPPADKLALLYAADKAARAADPRIVKVEASLVEQIKEVLVISSDGRMARDVQPLMRFGVSAVAEDGGKRQSGSSGGGGRFGLDYFAQPGKDAVSHGREARASRSPCSTRARRPPARWRWCWPPATAASCCTRRWATASRPTSTARRRQQLRGPSASRWPASCAPWSTTARSCPSRGTINVDDEGYTPTAARSSSAALVGYMQDRTRAPSTSASPHRQRPPRELPQPPHAAHDQHRSCSPGPHDPEEIIQSVKRGVYAKQVRRRPGGHLQRRLRLLAHRELPDRRRQASPRRSRA
jgi:TldD protein